MNDPTEDMLCLQHFDESIADFYRMANPEVPWGDYGAILIHGMANSDSRKNDSIELERTGPFIPPISFPGLGHIIVTEPVRHELEVSGLVGFSFVPVIKKTIVRVDWHEWDLSADEPAFHPDDGEPESYILGKQHSQLLADRMPTLWRLVIPEGATEIRVPEGVHLDINSRIFLRADSWTGLDFFRADTTLYNYVSARARLWLLDHYPAWVTFKPVEIK